MIHLDLSLNTFLTGVIFDRSGGKYKGSSYFLLSWKYREERLKKGNKKRGDTTHRTKPSRRVVVTHQVSRRIRGPTVLGVEAQWIDAAKLKFNKDQFETKRVVYEQTMVLNRAKRSLLGWPPR